MRLRGERVNLKALLAAAEFVCQEYLRRLVTLRARAPRETSSPNYMYVQLSDMGKKGKSFTQWITGSSGESTTSPLTDRSKDEVKKQNEQLFTELDSLNREYKKLKQVVEQLDREYEESKDYDPVRRYEKLKGMVKRTILHLKLNLDEQGPQSQASASGGIGLLQGCKEYAFQMESLKKREERFAGMAKQDIITENEQMADQIKEIKRKCSIIRDLVGQLESQYERSKRYIMVQRYRLLKTMVKTLIHDQLL